VVVVLMTWGRRMRREDDDDHDPIRWHRKPWALGRMSILVRGFLESDMGAREKVIMVIRFVIWMPTG
jgi:hypothetical protein